MAPTGDWQRFTSYYLSDPATGFAIDISRMNFREELWKEIDPKIQKAFAAMAELEKGAVANPDEKRMVGHYWLRTPALAPTPEIRKEIESTLKAIEEFAAGVHDGVIAPPKRKQFESLLVIGIGGSALGPQFVSRALSNPTDPLKLYFFDNTDPDGMDTVLRGIPDLAATLVVVISKSGGTKETRNGQLLAKRAFEKARIEFAKHFVAVTQDGSELDQTARREKWLARFPMWDWVGGRTSELSAVGLLPAALQGFDIRAMLSGASQMDALTRVHEVRKNPAALLAAMWYYAGSGKGTRDMVVLPYKDRIELFSRYLQQLVMESIGKEKDLDGKTVHQGIAVYGNKGSTDQHAYVQQLRDGLNNFFIVFVEVLKDLTGASGRFAESVGAMEVEADVTAGDYLDGFYLGSRRALHESGRESITITVPDVTPAVVGMLIALFERAVGFYASMINVNAYHQPGVEAGKKAAGEVLALQRKALQFLKARTSPTTLEAAAAELGEKANIETLFKVLEHLSANGRVLKKAGKGAFEGEYSIVR